MNQSPWVDSSEASKFLGISESALELMVERGYLKPGTHWRSAPITQQKPWKPKCIFHCRWCKEEMDYWLSHDAKILDFAT